MCVSGSSGKGCTQHSLTWNVSKSLSIPRGSRPQRPSKDAAGAPLAAWSSGSCLTGVRTKLSLQSLCEPTHPMAETRRALPVTGFWNDHEQNGRCSLAKDVYGASRAARTKSLEQPCTWPCSLDLPFVTHRTHCLRRSPAPTRQAPGVGPRARGAPPGKAAWLHRPSLQGQRHSCISLCH